MKTHKKLTKIKSNPKLILITPTTKSISITTTIIEFIVNQKEQLPGTIPQRIQEQSTINKTI